MYSNPSKFTVNNLVKHKFNKTESDSIVALEVIEVHAHTSSIGTEVFYTTRAIVCRKSYKKPYDKENSEFEWIVANAIAKTDLKFGYAKYREDELVELEKESISIILGE